MSETDLQVVLFSKSFVRQGYLDDVTRAKFTHRHNGRGVIELSVPTDHSRIGSLLTPGARVVVTYTAPGGTPVTMSGRAPSFRTESLSGGSGPAAAKAKHITATFASDWHVFDILAWPAPGNALTSQNVEYYTATGPAETVIKDLIAANKTRLGLPITVAATSGRGQTVKASLRMARLSDAITALADAGGIGVSIVQSGAGWLVDCYEGTDRTARVLSEASGTVTDWTWTATPPKATRVVVGGQGEGTARTFRAVTSPSLESGWGMVLEDFVDARDLSLGADLDTRGYEKLAEMAPASGFSVELSETDDMAYGRNLFVGDTITVEVLPGVTRTDVLRQVTQEWTRQSGLINTPTLGDPDAGPERATAKAIAKIAAAVRQLGAR